MQAQSNGCTIDAIPARIRDKECQRIVRTEWTLQITRNRVVSERRGFSSRKAALRMGAWLTMPKVAA